MVSQQAIGNQTTFIMHWYRFILGPIIIAACIAMMKYNVQLTEITGKFGWAEKWLQAPMAGTYTFYRLLALFIIVITLMWMFNYFPFLSF